jgi:hypothetical protein
VADCNPRRVEALMLLDFRTLYQLCAQRFRHEARRGASVVRAAPHLAERTPRSIGL